jgi:1-acyl-sn-glycerol-3-phosphate acyltransferase
VVRLALAGAGPRLAARARTFRDLAYAGWFWTLVGLAFPLAVVGLAVLPGVAAPRRYARALARGLARLAGTRLAARGLEHLAGLGPCVVAANHASYLDAFVLTAALPPRFAYLAKRELAGQLVPRFLLGRLRTVFVERFDPKQGIEDVRRAEEVLSAGDSLVVFPEGTFTRAPGLLPFQMGAFVAAAHAGVPVVPVGIRGARSLLRGDTWFPRPGAVAVTVAAPLPPGGGEWADAVRLRDAARAAILPASGEPETTPAAGPPERAL